MPAPPMTGAGGLWGLLYTGGDVILFLAAVVASLVLVTSVIGARGWLLVPAAPWVPQLDRPGPHGATNPARLDAQSFGGDVAASVLRCYRLVLPADGVEVVRYDEDAADDRDARSPDEPRPIQVFLKGVAVPDDVVDATRRGTIEARGVLLGRAARLALVKAGCGSAAGQLSAGGWAGLRFRIDAPVPPEELAALRRALAALGRGRVEVPALLRESYY